MKGILKDGRNIVIIPPQRSKLMTLRQFILEDLQTHSACTVMELALAAKAAGIIYPSTPRNAYSTTWQVLKDMINRKLITKRNSRYYPNKEK